MKLLWDTISHIGITEEIEYRERIKIRLLNQICIISFFTCFLILAICIALSEPLFVIVHNGITCCLSLLVLCLHAKQHFELPRHIACLLFPIWVSAVAVSQGVNNGETKVFILTVLLALMLYEGQHKLKLFSIGWNVFLVIISAVYAHQHFVEGVSSINIFGDTVITLAAIIIVVAIVTIYQKDITEFSNQKNELVIEKEYDG